MVNPGIFKTYDIRGKAGVDLTGETARRIGQALGTYLQRHIGLTEVVIGYDIRHSSLELRDGLVAGLNATGCATFDIGLVMTPLVYREAFRLGMAGVMITASHLGKEYNGFKPVAGRRPLWGEDIQAIGELARSGDFIIGQGKASARPGVNEAYVAALSTMFRSGRSLRVVVDAGNAMGGLYAPDLLTRLGHHVTPLYCEPDGDFPNHHPNPEKADNLRDLAAKVQEIGADVGLGFDGDADRVGVVDNTGAFISADKATAWLAQDVLRRNPGATFVGDVLSSQVVFDAVQQAGGRAILWQSGHARVKAKMQAEGAILGGESSGHLFFADRYDGYDDGVYAACRIVEHLSETDEPLSAQLARLPQMFTTPEYRPHCPDEKKAEVVAGVKALLGDIPLVDVDGLRVLFPNGWGLLRASGTEPVLSLRFEARSEADAWQYKARLVGLLKQVYPEVESF